MNLILITEAIHTHSGSSPAGNIIDLDFSFFKDRPGHVTCSGQQNRSEVTCHSWQGAVRARAQSATFPVSGLDDHEHVTEDRAPSILGPPVSLMMGGHPEPPTCRGLVSDQ